MPAQAQHDLEDMCRRLRLRRVEGASDCARATAELMRTVVTRRGHATPQALIDELTAYGAQLQAAKPHELSIGNVVRRVLRFVRDESQQESQEELAVEAPAAVAEARETSPGLISRAFRQVAPRAVSLHNLLDMQPIAEDDEDGSGGGGVGDGGNGHSREGGGGESKRSHASAGGAAGAGASESAARGRRERQGGWAGKANVIENLNEFIVELKDIESTVALHAVGEMSANEVILTFGWSATVFMFLREAAKKLDFEVVVAEAAPEYGGHRMARDLARAGIQTTLIPDSNVFAMMSRMSKVFVDAHALLANGGVMAAVGTHLVALAAKRYTVPFVVLAGLHKLSPLFPHDPAISFNEFKSPADIIDFDVLAETIDAAPPADDEHETARRTMAALAAGGHAQVLNPALDYVPPALIELLVTDTMNFKPSYVYHQLTEYYSREDFALEPARG
ncbi:hypothetical protein WJX81_003121 [Elliptochloris bilobata]|uniref:Translation initiation factor eIF2B subunit beta n=1 Tax=Elliptochloris bilobata TaxID=381761 RepID=A0AAW1SGG3_9CHLO